MESQSHIFVAWSWENDKIDRNRILGYEPEMIRRGSQAIERANFIIKSWVETGLGTILAYGGLEGSAEIPLDSLINLEKIKTQAECETGFILTFGVGTDIKKAYEVLALAKFQKVGQIVTWAPELFENIAKNSVGHIVPHPKGSVTGWAHKGATAEPFKASGVMGPVEPENDAEATNPIQANIEQFEQQEPFKKDKVSKDLIRILHEHAIKPNKPQTVVQNSTELEALKIKIAQLLTKIKEKVPDIAILRQQYPELYDAYIIMAKAFVDLVRQIGRKRGLEKTESDMLNEYEPLVKVRFKLGIGLSNLPIGSVFDNRMKILDKKTGQPKWRSLMAGMVMSPSGDAASSLNPRPE